MCLFRPAWSNRVPANSVREKSHSRIKFNFGTLRKTMSHTDCATWTSVTQGKKEKCGLVPIRTYRGETILTTTNGSWCSILNPFAALRRSSIAWVLCSKEWDLWDICLVPGSVWKCYRLHCHSVCIFIMNAIYIAGDFSLRSWRENALSIWFDGKCISTCSSLLFTFLWLLFLGVVYCLWKVTPVSHICECRYEE